MSLICSYMRDIVSVTNGNDPRKVKENVASVIAGYHAIVSSKSKRMTRKPIAVAVATIAVAVTPNACRFTIQMRLGMIWVVMMRMKRATPHQHKSHHRWR